MGLVLVLGALACRTPEPEPDHDSPSAPTCPTSPVFETRAPDIRPEHDTAEFWLARLEPGADTAVLLDANVRGLLYRYVREIDNGWVDLLEPGPDVSLEKPARIDVELEARLEFIRGKLDAGEYVELEPGAFERARARITDATAVAQPNRRFVIHETPIWCLPSTEGLFTTPIDRDFDRNRCAELHPGELVATLRTTSDGAWTYVAAGHSVGWVADPSAVLEPPLTVEQARARLAEPQLYINADYGELRLGSRFPLVAYDKHGFTIRVPSVDGPVERTLPINAPVSLAAWELTRRGLFERAFAHLDQPYGWGGRDGHRDCSRYLYDLFALFDVQLARNSAAQAKLGSYSVDLSRMAVPDKRDEIRKHAQAGVVLLYMPGHIMLYLGHDDRFDYGISALSEYLEPCEGGPDTVHRLDRVAVTTLELGRGTQRRSFLERITRMAVFKSF